MKYPHIDSARGIAILMVILIHTAQSVHRAVLDFKFIPHIIHEYGQMGVQLFFVVSAFTLCLSMDRRNNESKPLFSYSVRRYFRIAPAYYIGIGLYFIVNLFDYYVSHGTWHIHEKYTFTNILSNFLFLHGFYMPANNNIVPGGWSIATEMTFYLLFPFLFSFVNRIPPGFKNFCILVLFVCLLSLLINKIVYFYTKTGVANNNFFYYNIYNQLPVFVIGIVYYFLWKNKRLNFSNLINLSTFIFFTAGSMLTWLYIKRETFSLVPILSACSFVFLIELLRKTPFLNTSLIISIGKCSYSMYLLHFIFAWYVSKRIAPMLNQYFWPDFTLIILYIFTVTLTYQISKIFEKTLNKSLCN